MTGDAEVRSGVRAFILSNFLVGEPPESLRDSTRLISSGIISSVAMIELIAYLEGEYGIALDDEDLAPERLDTIDQIVSLVEEMRRREPSTQPTS